MLPFYVFQHCWVLFLCLPHILLWKQNLCASFTANCPNLHDDCLYNTISHHVAKWLSFLIVCLKTVGIFAYCVLAIEVVKKIVQSIYGFAAERASHILTLARREWKPSSADVSKEES